MKLSNYPIVSKSRNKNRLLSESTRGTFIIRALIRPKQIGTTFRRKLRSAWSAPWCKHECNCGAVRYTLIRRVARIPSLPWPRRATLWSPLSGFQPSFYPCLVFSGVGNAAKITHANNVRQIMFKKKKKDTCFRISFATILLQKRVWQLNNALLNYHIFSFKDEKIEEKRLFVTRLWQV